MFKNLHTLREWLKSNGFETRTVAQGQNLSLPGINSGGSELEQIADVYKLP